MPRVALAPPPAKAERKLGKPRGLQTMAHLILGGAAVHRCENWLHEPTLGEVLRDILSAEDWGTRHTRRQLIACQK